MSIEDIKSPDSFPLHRYEPIRKLGSGGAGVVFLCHDNILQRDVSVKVLTYENRDRIIAFQREAQVTAKLRHPNIVSILDFGTTDDGTPYMVLEFIEGISAAELLQRENRLTVDTTLTLIDQVAAALEYSHKSGIFHRDLKPSNIVLTQSNNEWHARLIDFGIALLEGDRQQTTSFQNKVLIGTPRYMPPDQVLGFQYSERSEVYALGCIMFEMLLGRVPFEAATATDTIWKHAHEPLPPMEEAFVSKPLAEIITKCMEKDPEYRFADMGDLRSAVSGLRQSLAEAVRTPLFPNDTTETAQPTQKPPSRRSQLVIASLAALLILIIVVSPMVLWPQPSYTPKLTINFYEEDGSGKHSPFEDWKDQSNHNVRTASPVKDRDLKWLKDHKPIHYLELSGTEITGTGFASMPDVTIMQLNLERNPTTDKGLKQIAKIKGLTTLFLQQNNRITSAGLANLDESTSLTSIVFSGRQLSEESFASLKTIKNLDSVHPHLMTITARGGELLASLPAMHNVSFRQCEVEPGALERLALDKNLTSIGFHDMSLGDRAIDSLLKLRLERIDFMECDISKSALNKLTGCKAIYSGHLVCTEATNADIQRFKKSLPNVYSDRLIISTTRKRKKSLDSVYE